MKELLEKAKSVQKNSYSPYSKFPVGAALRSDKGNIYTGCNVENISFGLTICAERNAVFKMVASGDRKIKEILILGNTEEPLAPCGACRQVLAEFSEPDTTVYMVGKGDKFIKTDMMSVLPHVFNAKEMKNELS